MPPTASGQGEPCAAEPRNAHQRLKKLIPPSRLAPEASKFQSPPTHAKRFCKRLHKPHSRTQRSTSLSAPRRHNNGDRRGLILCADFIAAVDVALTKVTFDLTTILMASTILAPSKVKEGASFSRSIITTWTFASHHRTRLTRKSRVEP